MKKVLFLILAAGMLMLPACAHHSLVTEGDTVTITLKAPGAKEVLFASSLDGFELHPAHKKGLSGWVVEVPSGAQFSYFYSVDGKVYIPDCTFVESDDFGSRNCVYVPGM